MSTEELENLKDATMTYPTWDWIKNVINEYVSTPQKDYPFNNPLERDTLFPDILKINIKNNKRKFVGIDVPVLLTPQDPNGKTIVIVGESPLRDTKNENKLLLGTPYAVDCQYGVPSQCNVYKRIINDLLKEGYSVYLTDIIKVWWKGKELKVSEEDKILFMREMEKIGGDDPSKIFFVAWGNKAGGILKKGYKSLIRILHPSKQNWNNWRLHIFEKAIYNNDISYATTYYPKISSTTNEGIVATEAVREILDNVKNNESEVMPSTKDMKFNEGDIVGYFILELKITKDNGDDTCNCKTPDGPHYFYSIKKERLRRIKKNKTQTLSTPDQHSNVLKPKRNL